VRAGVYLHPALEVVDQAASWWGRPTTCRAIDRCPTSRTRCSLMKARALGTFKVGIDPIGKTRTDAVNAAASAIGEDPRAGRHIKNVSNAYLTTGPAPAPCWRSGSSRPARRHVSSNVAMTGRSSQMDASRMSGAFRKNSRGQPKRPLSCTDPQGQLRTRDWDVRRWRKAPLTVLEVGLSAKPTKDHGRVSNRDVEVVASFATISFRPGCPCGRGITLTPDAFALSAITRGHR